MSVDKLLETIQSQEHELRKFQTEVRISRETVERLTKRCRDLEGSLRQRNEDVHHLRFAFQCLEGLHERAMRVMAEIKKNTPDRMARKAATAFIEEVQSRRSRVDQIVLRLSKLEREKR